jgi:hypothetical protein
MDRHLLGFKGQFALPRIQTGFRRASSRLWCKPPLHRLFESLHKLCATQRPPCVGAPANLCGIPHLAKNERHAPSGTVIVANHDKTNNHGYWPAPPIHLPGQSPTACEAGFSVSSQAAGSRQLTGTPVSRALRFNRQKAGCPISRSLAK